MNCVSIVCGNHSGHTDILGESDLSLDLLTSPPGRLDRTGGKLTVGPGFANQTHDEIVAEVYKVFALGEHLGEIATLLARAEQQTKRNNIPNNTHGRSQQTLTAVGVLGNDPNKLEH